MSTRGIVGFVVDEKVYATYNHSDSYPSWLGQRVLKYAETLRDPDALEAARAQVRSLVMVADDDEVPTDADLALLRGRGIVPNMSVGGGVATSPTWYQALRDLQGDLAAQLAAGYMIDGKGFAEDSLFCEYGYLVNLDEQVIEFYTGFQREPGAGRFAPGLNNRGYYAITLAATYPFPVADEIAATVTAWSKAAGLDDEDDD